jgi:hypothetical protein
VGERHGLLRRARSRVRRGDRAVHVERRRDERSVPAGHGAARGEAGLAGALEQLAKHGKAGKKALGYYYDPYDRPETPEELLNELRELFELSPTSQVAEVLGELAKLRAWATGGMAPPIGVDVACIVGDLRCLFNLPTLSTVEAVFDEASKLLGALAESAAAAPPAPAGDQSSAAPAATATREMNMDPILKMLAARFGIPADEESVKKAVVAKLEGGESAMAGLQAILSALGVEDVSGATAKIAQMFKSVDELEKAMPELKSLRDQQMQAEEEDASQDVEQAMASYAMPAVAKAALTSLRTGGVEAKDLAGRKAAKTAFAKAYPKVEAARAALLKPTFAGGSGGPVQQLKGKVESTSRRAGDDAQVVQVLTEGPVIDLERYQGNATEKALAWVNDNDPSAKTMTREAAFFRAREVLAQARSMGQHV